MVKIKLWGRPLTKERILNMWVLFNMRQGRGSGLINQLRLNEYVVIAGALTILFPWVTKVFLIVFGFIFLVGTYYLGYFDEKKLKLWQLEREKQDQHANPFTQRLERRLIRIEEKLKTDQGQDKEAKHSGK